MPQSSHGVAEPSVDLGPRPDRLVWCLDEALDDVWRRLVDGVTSRHSPCHLPTLATTRADGTPDLRTVVLRQAERDQSRLRFHTDLRSGKVDQLVRQPRCALHVYDPNAKTQIRLNGHAQLHHVDEVSDLAWTNSRPASQACYGQALAPGRRIKSPSQPAETASLDSTAARGNFAAVVVTLDRIEWLFLHHVGHRRAAWKPSGDMWHGHWLAP